MEELKEREGPSKVQASHFFLTSLFYDYNCGEPQDEEKTNLIIEFNYCILNELLEKHNQSKPINILK